MRLKKLILAIASTMTLALAVSGAEALAADTSKLTITPDKTTAAAGDTVKYTVKVSAISNLYGLQLQLDIPSGLTYVSGSYSDGELPAAFSDNFAEETLFYLSQLSDAYSSDDDTVIFTFSCKVDSSASGDLSVGVVSDELVFIDYDVNDITIDASNLGSTVTVSGSSGSSGNSSGSSDSSSTASSGSSDSSVSDSAADSNSNSSSDESSLSDSSSSADSSDSSANSSDSDDTDKSADSSDSSDSSSDSSDDEESEEASKKSTDSSNAPTIVMIVIVIALILGGTVTVIVLRKKKNADNAMEQDGADYLPLALPTDSEAEQASTPTTELDAPAENQQDDSALK